MGRAFEEQTKTMKDQQEKQIKAIQNQGQVKAILKYTFNDKDEKLEEIIGLDKIVNPGNLIYRCKDLTADVKFDEFDNALNLLDKIKGRWNKPS